MHPKKYQPTSTHQNTLREPDLNTRAELINELNKASWFRLNGLLEGMLMRASNDLFEEIRHANSREWITRNFNSMRALMVGRESLLSDFRDLMSESWHRLDQPALQTPLEITSEVSEVINDFVRKSTAANQTILSELDRKLGVLSAGVAGPHPLKPEHLLQVFWKSTEAMSITVPERLVLLKLFGQSILRDATAVWVSVLAFMNTLEETPGD